jgi:hypothetical protein
MIDTYDLEDVGSGYMQYRDMVKCEESEWCRGDWVSAEDHDKEVKRLREAFMLAVDLLICEFDQDNIEMVDDMDKTVKLYHKFIEETEALEAQL